MVEIRMYLFGKPGWEFGEKIDPAILQAKGEELKHRLGTISKNVQKLSARNWDYELGLYDISFWKNSSKEAAQKELREMDIEEEIFDFEEDAD